MESVLLDPVVCVYAIKLLIVLLTFIFVFLIWENIL